LRADAFSPIIREYRQLNRSETKKLKHGIEGKEEIEYEVKRASFGDILHAYLNNTNQGFKEGVESERQKIFRLGMEYLEQHSSQDLIDEQLNSLERELRI